MTSIVPVTGGRRAARLFRCTASVAAIGWAALSLIAASVDMEMPAGVQVAGIGALMLRLVFYVADVRFLMRSRTYLEAATHALPIFARRIVKTEIEVYTSFAKSLVRRPTEPTGYTFMKAPKYTAFLYLAVLSAILEAPVLFVVVRSFSSGSTRLLIDVVAAAGSLYFFVLLRADWFAMSSSGHNLADGQLLLNLGFRFRGRVPIDMIESIFPISRDQKGPRGGSSVRITPLDAPNVYVKFHSPCVVGEHWLRGSSLADGIELYVDDPRALIAFHEER